MDYLLFMLEDTWSSFKQRLAENGCYILKDVIMQESEEITANYGLIKTRGIFGGDMQETAHSFLAGEDETVGTISTEDSDVFIVNLREDVLLSIRKGLKPLKGSGEIMEYSKKEYRKHQAELWKRMDAK